MIQLFTYHTGCKACGGEGIVSETYPSIGGVGGAVTVDAGCKACNATGRGELVEVPYCDVCDGENIENGVCLDCEALCDCPDPVVVEGVTVDAPGFEDDAEIEAVYMGERNAAFEQFLAWYEADMLTRHQLQKWLLAFWSAAEWPMNTAHGLGMDEWSVTTMFQEAGFLSDDPNAAPPSEPMRLYRGCTEHGAHGLSWTVSPETARWFARREALFNRDPEEHGDPVMIAATISPEHILATITGGRGEAEVIIDPLGAADAINRGTYYRDLDTPDVA